MHKRPIWPAHTMGPPLGYCRRAFRQGAYMGRTWCATGAPTSCGVRTDACGAAIGPRVGGRAPLGRADCTLRGRPLAARGWGRLRCASLAWLSASRTSAVAGRLKEAAGTVNTPLPCCASWRFLGHASTHVLHAPGSRLSATMHRNIPQSASRSNMRGGSLAKHQAANASWNCLVARPHLAWSSNFTFTRVASATPVRLGCSPIRYLRVPACGRYLWNGWETRLEKETTPSVRCARAARTALIPCHVTIRTEQSPTLPFLHPL